MTKTKQPELLLQAEIMGNKETSKDKPKGLRGQGFYCEKQSERFKAGRPDLRVARADQGQLDVELKYCNEEWISESDEPIAFGFTTLQWLKIKEMNDHGIPTVGLVYMARHDHFLLTLDRVLRPMSTKRLWVCSKLPAPLVIDGVALFEAAKGLLNDAGYRHRW